MGVCWADGCLSEAKLKCSGCKTAWYCRPECQHASWATHKKECKMNRLIYDMEQKKEKEAAQRPIEKPRTTHCTGCNVKYSEDYESDQICPDCGYTTCESCSCHNSRGSCYCPNSNFGYSYCESEPQWYHMSSRTGRMYKGDYHPNYVHGVDLKDHMEIFEEEARECNNCGKVVRCLKKEVVN